MSTPNLWRAVLAGSIRDIDTMLMNTKPLYVLNKASGMYYKEKDKAVVLSIRIDGTEVSVTRESL